MKKRRAFESPFAEREKVLPKPTLCACAPSSSTTTVSEEDEEKLDRSIHAENYEETSSSKFVGGTQFRL